ncbi:hypothetical protein [Cupriavidus oxalaticus]|uniref:hypothetical protein n=1 Tax=Cupriavidus oxalaticus TaxID=96344 RepID=UPI003172EE91
MKRKFLHYVLMDAAGGDGGAGGGGAPAGGAPAGGEGGQPSGGQPAGSLLAGGAAGGQPTEFIPEKFRVTKDDGTLDLESSSRKMAETYGQLERRLGTADAPPKSAEEYAVTVPDTLKDAFDPKTDEGFKSFAGKMHGLGLSQKQMDAVMESYFEMAPKLVGGAAALDEQSARADLEKTWGTGKAFDDQVKLSYKGAAAIASKAGLNIDDLMRPDRLGNNTDFLRLMAAIAPEFAEDTSPGGGGIDMPTSQEEVDKLMTSEAYTNAKHPEHAKVSKQVQAYFQKKYPGDAL